MPTTCIHLSRICCYAFAGNALIKTINVDVFQILIYLTTQLKHIRKLRTTTKNHIPHASGKPI